jgi:hypothetical protein
MERSHLSELKNIKFLNGYLNFKTDDTFQSKCSQLLAIIDDLVQTTPEKLLNFISKDKLEQAEWIPLLWHLVATKQIRINLSMSLSMRSQIWSK